MGAHRYLSQRALRQHVQAQTMTVAQIERILVTLLNLNVLERLVCVVCGPRVLLRWKGQDV